MGTLIDRLPQDDEELWHLVVALTGVRIPRRAVCPNHVAPFTAFADAYFARHQVTVWKASRGFGGKSYLLATLGYMEQVILGASVSVLGGSASQSQNVVRYITRFWNHPRAPRGLLTGEPGKFETYLNNGSFLRALAASQTSVRGPHPHRLRLDEVDEMELPILDAAFGQPMRGIEQIPTQIVISSTHQYPDGTMTEVLKRAKEKQWKVNEWCWQENVAEPDGWLTQAEIATKRAEVTDLMWRTEYDLQEPSAQGRAITPDAVDAMFDPALGAGEGTLGQDMEFEDPVPWGIYATGADWGKKLHYSCIVTFRLDCTPGRIVALWRDHRKPYSIMAPVLNRRMRRFPGKGVHDSMGVGEAVGEHLTLPVEGYDKWQGKERYTLFNEYIAAVEQGKLVGPRIEAWYQAHKFLTNDDLFGSSGHPPDEVAACALAWRARPPYLGAHAEDVPVLQGAGRVGNTAMRQDSGPPRSEPNLPGGARRSGLVI